MRTAQTPLIVANWKMHPKTLDAAADLFDAVKEQTVRIRGAHIVLCPPFVYLPELTAMYRGSRIAFGAQDAHWESTGSFTGEVSAAQLADLGADYVILGHSERRAMGETSETIARKAGAVLAAGLSPIICVGEDERDQDGAYLAAVRQEVTESIAGIGPKQLGRVILAYEPRWAIGKGADAALPGDELYAMVVLLRKIVTEMHDRAAAQRVRVLYGGSAEPANAGTLITRGGVDGLLVGHASLRAETFTELIRAAVRGTDT